MALKRLEGKKFRQLFRANLPLLCILAGAALFTYTSGPFQNWDTNVEFQAVQGVLKWGIPYTEPGAMINQPPIAFYVYAAPLTVLGATEAAAALVNAAFGLACTFLVYLLGKVWFNKIVGLAAAALFALTPWAVAFCRSSLIDTQCLFFSLLFLLVGIYAIRRDSWKLFLVSGVLFGVAFLTKFYAVFMLLPLALAYLGNNRHKLWHPLISVGFFLPALAFLTIWYEGALHRSIFTILGQSDFHYTNPATALPSPLFLLTFLSLNLGLLFLLAIGVSLLVTFSQRGQLGRFWRADLLCLATILLVVGVDAVLAVPLNLKSPYLGAAKYLYQALPFFCLLAASLVAKAGVLSANKKIGRQRLIWVLTCIGLGCLAVSALSYMYYLELYSHWDYVLFEVAPQLGFSFYNMGPTAVGSVSWYAMIVGFALAGMGLAWAIKEGAHRKTAPQK